MKHLSVLSVLLLCAVSALAPGRALAAKSTYSITYDSRAMASTLWYPDKLAVIRGVIVFTGGASGNGSGDTRGQVENKFWQRFAEAYGFGLLGNQFTGQYTNAANGTGKALLDTFLALADSTKHPELARAPLLLEGFSNGGYFSFTFAQFLPARVIAFCVNKSGFAKAPMDAPFLAVPGMLIWGSEEPASNVPTVIHSLVQQGRTSHALWSELKDWGAAHEEGGGERAFAPFFAEMIGARYPADASPADGEVTLIALREDAGWLGDHSDDSINGNVPRIGGFGSYSGDKTAASWLPSEALANIWRGFVTKNPITLSSPSAGAQADANQALQLTATGFAAGDSASFLAGATSIAKGVSVSGGQAKSSWMPSAGGVAGLVAHAVSTAGDVTRVSRPVHVALYGKPIAQGTGSVDSGTAAGAAGRGATRDAGMDTAGNGSVAGSGSTIPSAGAPATGGSGGPVARADAGALEPDASELRGGCSVCGVGVRSGVASSWVGLLLLLSARRRAHVRSTPATLQCDPR